MNLTTGDISPLVFRRTVRNDIGDFSLNRRMLTVFMELDGKKSLGSIARQKALTMNALREVVTGLLKIRLIEEVDKKIATIDEGFFVFLVSQLSLAVGPIAQFIVEDEVKDEGFELSSYPKNRIVALVEKLSGDIRKVDKKQAFRQTMMRKIRDQK